MHYFKIVILGFIFLISLSALFENKNLRFDLSFRPGKDIAVFFAVKDYDEWEDLKNPIRDAEAIAQILAHQYAFDTVILRNPTKNEIRQKIRQLSKLKFEQDQQLLIFFTGHGLFIPYSQDSEEGRGYFIPKDGKSNDTFGDSYLSYLELSPDLDNMPCKHILVTIDACFSGAFLKLKGERWGRLGELSQRKKTIQNILTYTTRIAITSGGNERTKGGINHSPLTEKFLQALEDGGGADQILRIPELFSYLQNITPNPQRGYFGRNSPSSDFMFIREPAFWKINNESVGTSTVEGEYLTDHRDNNQKYKTIVLNGKRWMTQNMSFDAGLGAWCYAGDEAICASFGRLYTWEKAKSTCEGLGHGWRLPKEEEWKELIEAYNGSKEAFLKGGSSGIDLTLGGIRRSKDNYAHNQNIGYYWSETEKDEEYAQYFYLSKKNNKVLEFYSDKKIGRSCRCLQDIKKE